MVRLLSREGRDKGGFYSLKIIRNGEVGVSRSPTLHDIHLIDQPQQRGYTRRESSSEGTYVNPVT